MRKREIQADILAKLSDGRVWTIKEIAEELEVHYNTVYNHIHDLSYRFNIRIYKGGSNNGGVQFIKERSIKIEQIEEEELYRIYLKLMEIKVKSEGILLFISRLYQEIDKEKVTGIKVCN